VSSLQFLGNQLRVFSSNVGLGTQNSDCDSVLNKSIVPNLILAGSSLAVTLLMAELFFHFIHPIPYRRPPIPIPEDSWHRLLHRPSSVPGLAYELIPNREQFSRGALIRTNSFGMRDDEPRPGTDETLHRIVVLGDSYTFGFGVPGEATYSNVLERLLNEKSKAKQFEVLNFGVGGYSTHDEALVLEYKGMRWNPEMVILGYVLNDPEIDPIQPLQQYYQKISWWQYSNVLRLVARVKNYLDVMELGDGDYIKYLHADRRKWRSVLQGFDKIASLARERKIPVLVLIFPLMRTPWAEYPYRNLHQQVANAAKGKGLYVIDLYAPFLRYTPEELRVSLEDEHPSSLAHQLTADAVYEWMVAHNHQFEFLPQGNP
jgi:GDSL-like lipase/acylhydrolase family protein